MTEKAIEEVKNIISDGGEQFKNLDMYMKEIDLLDLDPTGPQHTGSGLHANADLDSRLGSLEISTFLTSASQRRRKEPSRPAASTSTSWETRSNRHQTTRTRGSRFNATKNLQLLGA